MKIDRTLLETRQRNESKCEALHIDTKEIGRKSIYEQRLASSKHAGIHPFCITIDRSAMDYLPHMYGAVNYTVVEDVRKLPARVSDIYRRLTR